MSQSLPPYVPASLERIAFNGGCCFRSSRDQRIGQRRHELAHRIDSRLLNGRRQFARCYGQTLRIQPAIGQRNLSFTIEIIDQRRRDIALVHVETDHVQCQVEIDIASIVAEV